MLVLKRKSILVFSLVLLLVITGYINYKYNESFDGDAWMEIGDSNKEVSDDEKIQIKDKAGDISDIIKDVDTDNIEVIAEGSNFFVEYRLERDRTRSKGVDELKNIVENKETDAKTKQNAQNKMIDMIDRIEKEMVVENLIKSVGFDDVVSIIHDDSVSIIVNQKDLTVAQVSQIQSIVLDKTSCDIENIKIIERK